jgi:hypothetical protein
MKKGLFKLVVLAIVGLASYAHAAPDLCELIRAAKSGQFTPQTLCNAYQTSFCSGYSMSSAICEIGGGSFCRQVKNDFQAICEINRDSFCSSMDDASRLRYFNIISNCLR